MPARQFMSGMLTMASIVAAVFFLKFWRLAGDRLFAYFSCAFACLAGGWVVLALEDGQIASRKYGYLAHLLAFVLIIIGVIDKNRQRSGGGAHR